MSSAIRETGRPKMLVPEQVYIKVPLVAPTVNMYVRHTRKGRHYVTAEAQAFKDALIIYARQQNATNRLGDGPYELEATVYLGKGGKGDGDNFWKCIADGLKEAQVIRSDAAVTDWIMHVRRDWAAPRTEIIVTTWK